jgi:hypothetical protein
LQRLARVARLELGDLVAVGLDRVGELEQRQRALAGRRVRPTVERRPRGLDGAPDVFARRIRRLREGLAVGRVQYVGGAALSRSDGLAVDEVGEGPGAGGGRLRSSSGQLQRTPPPPQKGSPGRLTGPGGHVAPSCNGRHIVSIGIAARRPSGCPTSTGAGTCSNPSLA